MNANLTLSEIITIAFILLLVFGPQRLPEMARKAGEFLGKLRTSVAAIRDEFMVEYEEIAKPLTDLDAEIKAVKGELQSAVPDMTPITEGLDEAITGNGSTDGATEDGDGAAAAPDEPGTGESEVEGQAGSGNGNGEADPFEAKLAAAKEEARAELAEAAQGAVDTPPESETEESESQ